MEEYFTEGIEEFWIKIPAKQKEKLAEIRLWEHLRIAIDNDVLWIRGIKNTEIDSVEIQRIPYKEVFYLKNGYLIKKGNQLPEFRIRTSWFWSPIKSAFPIELPKYNHNYFEINENIEVKLVKTTTEQKPNALLISLDELSKYILKAPEVRLKPLRWTLIQNNFALILGLPMLPVSGKTFWQSSDFLIPSGFDFEFPNLASHLNKAINKEQQNIIWFQGLESYSEIPKQNFNQLSISSFRLTETNHG